MSKSQKIGHFARTEQFIPVSKMKSAFLLRFQETCVSADTDTINCGTETKTRKNREDAKHAGFHAIAGSTNRNATGTITRIARETADTLGNHAVLPRNEPLTPVASTKTVTNVRAEQDDNDPGKSARCVFPITSPSLSSGTATKTAVKIEQTDNDRHERFFSTIPKCS